MTRLASGARAVLRSAARRTGQRARRVAVVAPLDTGGFLGASVAAWISTSPSLLPRTWWMWAVNIGLSEVYGYASGVLAKKLVRRIGGAIGLHKNRARRRLVRQWRCHDPESQTWASLSWPEGRFFPGDRAGSPPLHLRALRGSRLIVGNSHDVINHEASGFRLQVRLRASGLGIRHLRPRGARLEDRDFGCE